MTVRTGLRSGTTVAISPERAHQLTSQILRICDRWAMTPAVAAQLAGRGVAAGGGWGWGAEWGGAF